MCPLRNREHRAEAIAGGSGGPARYASCWIRSMDARELRGSRDAASPLVASTSPTSGTMNPDQRGEQHPKLRLVPDSGRTDPCQVGRPAGGERARAVRAFGRSARWSGASCDASAPAPGPTPLRARSTKRGRARPRGVRHACRKRREGDVSCAGLRGASPHSTVCRRIPPILRGIQL